MREPYQIKHADRTMLMGAVGLPHDVRIEVLRKMFEGRNTDDFIEVFSQFIGLTNTVIENNREMIELFLITEHDYMPTHAEKINLPTLFGALNGLGLAEGIDQNRVCSGCAYRIGSPANTSAATTCDADWQQQNSDMFYCHENLKPDGTPSRKCTGFLQQRKLNHE